MNLQERLEKAAIINMPKNSLRVYLYMLSKAKKTDEYIHMSQDEMRNLLSLSQPAIVKAVRELGETGLIEIKKVSKYNYYKII